MMTGFSTATASQTRWLWSLGFFIACPMLLGLPLGWYQAGAAALLPTRGSALALWTIQWLISWWIAEVLFQVARAGLRPVTRAMAPALALAAIGNALLASVYAAPYFDLIAMVSGSPARLPTDETGRNLLDPAYLWVLLQATAPSALLWMALRALFEQVRPTEPSPVTARRLASPRHASALMTAAAAQGLQPHDILAATAEDHYVRLHAATRSVLLSWRFADALIDLDALDGVRTHRSAWVRLDAVQGVERNGTRRRVLLANGARLPLSERHAALLEVSLARRAMEPA